MSSTDAWIESYIGLGSNLDDPVRQVISAAGEVAKLEGIEEISLSPLYSSQPVGPQDQPDYVNAVIRIKTRLMPLDLLKQLQNIENQHERVRLQRCGARTLDLDILLYGQQHIDLPDLKVPHPEMVNRGFVLYPLADIAPLNLPIPGKDSLGNLLLACPQQDIHRLT